MHGQGRILLSENMSVVFDHQLKVICRKIVYEDFKFSLSVVSKSFIIQSLWQLMCGTTMEPNYDFHLMK